MAWGPKQAASKTARTPGEPPADSPSLSGDAFPQLGGGGARRQAAGAWGAPPRETAVGARVAPAAAAAPQPQEATRKAKEEDATQPAGSAEQQVEETAWTEAGWNSWKDNAGWNGSGSWHRWKEEERPKEKLQEGGDAGEERHEADGDASTQALLQRLEPMGGASAFLTVTAGLDLAALLGLLHVIRGDSGPDGLDVAAWEELAAMVQRFGGPRAVLDLLEVEKVHAAVVEALSGGSQPAATAEAASHEEPVMPDAAQDAEQSKEDPAASPCAVPLPTRLSVDPMQGAPWETAIDPAPAQKPAGLEAAPEEAAPKSSWAAMVSSNAPSAAPPTKAAWAGKGAPGKGGPSLPPHPSTPAPRPPGEPPKQQPPPEAAPQQPAWPPSAPAWGPQSKAPQRPPDGYAPGPEAPQQPPPDAPVPEVTAGLQQAPAWGPAPTSPPTVAPGASKWLTRVGIVAAPPPRQEQAEEADEKGSDGGDAEEEELKIDGQEPPWEEPADEADAAAETAAEAEVAGACEEEPAATAGPGPASSLAPATGPAKEQRLAGTKLSEWLRRRVFQLRVTLPIGHSELLEVLQNLDDDKLRPPFEEAKLWLGFDDADSLPKGLEQLMTDFRDVRVRP